MTKKGFDQRKPHIQPRAISSYEALSILLGVDSLETLLLLSLLRVSTRQDNKLMPLTFLMTHVFARKRPMTIAINPYIVLEPIKRTSSTS
jgi:hypothetical protein